MVVRDTREFSGNPHDEEKIKIKINCSTPDQFEFTSFQLFNCAEAAFNNKTDPWLVDFKSIAVCRHVRPKIQAWRKR